MGKNIVVFSDGTEQDGGTGHNTNVYKLFNLILDRSRRQVSFYDRGLVTGWRKATGNVAGRGFPKSVRQCYEFILFGILPAACPRRKSGRTRLSGWPLRPRSGGFWY